MLMLMLIISGRTGLVLKRLSSGAVGLVGLAAILFSLWLMTTPASASAAGIVRSQLPQISNTTTATTTEAAPTPTAPSWSRPNLHLYFLDEQGQPLVGVKVAIYLESYNAATKKLEAHSVLSGISDREGRASFDVTRLMPGVYYLELHEADGSLVLPKDPDLFVPGQSVGQPQQNPALTYMSGLDLNYGSVVYVEQYQLRKLQKPFEVTPTPISTSTSVSAQPTTQGQSGSVSAGANIKASRAIYWQETKRYIYYPPFGSDLASIGNGTNASNTPAPGATSSSFVPGNGTSIVQPGLRGVPNTPTPAGISALNPAPSVSTATPLPTATPLECRGCLSPGASPDSPPTLTARAESGLDAGRGGSGRLTPTPIPPGVLTQRAEAAERRTATALAGLPTSGTGSGTLITPPLSTSPTAPTAGSSTTTGNNGSSGNSLTLPTPAFSVELGLGVAVSPSSQGQAPTAPVPSPTPSPNSASNWPTLGNTSWSWVDLLIAITGVLAVIALVAGGIYLGRYFQKYRRFPWQ